MRLTRLGDTGWSVLALFAAFAFVSFSTAVIGPVLGQLDDEFGVSYASLGLIAGMQALGRGVAMIPAGRVADRYPPRLLVSLGGVLMVIGSLASAAAPVYPVLVFGTAVIGVSMALIFTAGMAHLIRSAPTEERGRTMGRAMAGWGLGSLLAPAGRRGARQRLRLALRLHSGGRAQRGRGAARVEHPRRPAARA